MGSIDRVIVNAGIGLGKALGTGGFDQNLATLQTNLIAGLAQIEAAMEIFRWQGSAPGRDVLGQRLPRHAALDDGLRRQQGRLGDDR